MTFFNCSLSVNYYQVIIYLPVTKTKNVPIKMTKKKKTTPKSEIPHRHIEIHNFPFGVRLSAVIILIVVGCFFRF